MILYDENTNTILWRCDSCGCRITSAQDDNGGLCDDCYFNAEAPSLDEWYKL